MWPCQYLTDIRLSSNIITWTCLWISIIKCSIAQHISLNKCHLLDLRKSSLVAINISGLQETLATKNTIYDIISSIQTKKDERRPTASWKLKRLPQAATKQYKSNHGAANKKAIVIVQVTHTHTTALWTHYRHHSIG